MTFWLVAGGILVVVMGVVWWTSRRSNRAFRMGTDYERLRGQAAAQAQHTKNTIGDQFPG